MKNGMLGTGLVFLPEYHYEAILCMEVLTRFIREEGLELIEYLELESRKLFGRTAAGQGDAHIAQLYVRADMDKEVFEQKLDHIRKQAQEQILCSKLKHRREFSVGTFSAAVLRSAS